MNDFGGDHGDMARAYYGETEPMYSPFEREIERQDFGPRWCPGWNHADCTTRISGPQYFCDACTAKSEEFRQQLRRELGK